MLVDGMYMIAWPKAAAIGPAAACALGMAFGAGLLRGSNQITFTYSMPMMVMLVAIGHLGGAIGAWLTAGYVLADFLFFPHGGPKYPTVFAQLTQDQLPLWVGYALLAILLIVVPAMASRLRHRTISPLRLALKPRLVANAVIQASTQAVLVYLWVLATPMLIRPVFTFRNLGTPVEAFYPLQHSQAPLIITTAMAGILRSVLEARALADPIRSSRVTLSLSALALALTSRLRPPSPWVAVPVRGLLMTFLLLGFIASWGQAFGVAALMMLLVWARDVVIPQRGARWTALMSRVPAIVRFAGGMLASYFLVRAVLGAMWQEAAFSMRPGLFGIVLSLALFTVLFPQEPGTVRRERGAATPSGIAGVSLFLLLSSTSPAFADNCSTITDCIPSFVWALLGIVACVLVLVIVFFFVIVPAFTTWVEELISGSVRRSGPAGEAGAAGRAGAAGEAGSAGETAVGGAARAGTAAGETVAGGAARGGAATAEELAAQEAFRRTTIQEAGLAYDEAAAAAAEISEEARAAQILRTAADDICGNLNSHGPEGAADLVRGAIQRFGPEGMASIAAELEEIVALGGARGISAEQARLALVILRNALGG